MSIYQSALMLSNDKLSYERRPKDLDLMPEVKEESTPTQPRIDTEDLELDHGSTRILLNF